MTSNSPGGKGSGRRPSNVPQEVFDNNWDKIFGKKRKPSGIDTDHYCQLYAMPANPPVDFIRADYIEKLGLSPETLDKPEEVQWSSTAVAMRCDNLFKLFGRDGRLPCFGSLSCNAFKYAACPFAEDCQNACFYTPDEIASWFANIDKIESILADSAKRELGFPQDDIDNIELIINELVERTGLQYCFSNLQLLHSQKTSQVIAIVLTADMHETRRKIQKAIDTINGKYGPFYRTCFP